MIPDNNSSRPSWWTSNEQIKQSYDLPEYTPPRFRDGPYVHEIVENLEEEFGVQIRFVNSEPVEDSIWQVIIDGESIIEFERYRNEKANSVFEFQSDEFRDLVKSNIK